MHFYRLINFSFLVLLFAGCASSLPLKKVSNKEATKIEVTGLQGNYNKELFYTKSRVNIFERQANDKKAIEEKLIEDKLEEATFSLNRTTLDVDTDQRLQYKTWVTDLKGKVDLTAMGFPPKDGMLLSVVNKNGEVVAVKNMPTETVFYLPRIPLPKTPIKAGDTWTYSKQWRSLKTGWPFMLDLDVEFKDWYNCGGSSCLHVTYKGKVSIPENNPVKDSKLESELEGEFIYAPTGDQFLWTGSKNAEVFNNQNKRIKIESCVTSYQVQPNKITNALEKKFKDFCS